MTRKWYGTLRHPKMHPHTKVGIPTSKNIGDMHRTRSGTDRRTHGRTDGRTVRLLYASQSSFGGIKIIVILSDSDCQTIWIQFKPDIMSSLIWVQTVCIGYQQTASRRWQEFNTTTEVSSGVRKLNSYVHEGANLTPSGAKN